MCCPVSFWTRFSDTSVPACRGRLKVLWCVDPLNSQVTDLSDFTQADFDQVAAALNDRPRKILGCRTPAEVNADASQQFSYLGIH